MAKSPIVKTLLAIIVCIGSATAPVYADNLTLVGGTVINPADGKTTPNAIVTIDGDTIQDIGTAPSSDSGGRSIDCKGKFILPGYFDAHSLFSVS